MSRYHDADNPFADNRAIGDVLVQRGTDLTRKKLTGSGGVGSLAENFICSPAARELASQPCCSI
jgi:hypothetical protein